MDNNEWCYKCNKSGHLGYSCPTSPYSINKHSDSDSDNQSQRSVRGDQENRTQRSPQHNNAFNQRPYGESKGEEGELKEGGGGGRDFRDNRDGRRNGFGGGRGGRRGGPGTGQGGASFSGKRDFNRHSGSDKTGVKATEKRDGAGAHNWGKSVDDFTATPEDELVSGEQTAEAPAEEAEPSGEELKDKREREKIPSRFDNQPLPQINHAMIRAINDQSIKVVNKKYRSYKGPYSVSDRVEVKGGGRKRGGGGGGKKFK